MWESTVVLNEHKCDGYLNHLVLLRTLRKVQGLLSVNEETQLVMVHPNLSTDTLLVRRDIHSYCLLRNIWKHMTYELPLEWNSHSPPVCKWYLSFSLTRIWFRYTTLWHDPKCQCPRPKLRVKIKSRHRSLYFPCLIRDLWSVYCRLVYFYYFLKQQ